MNFSFLATLLAISFIKSPPPPPTALTVCNNEFCNERYMPTTVQLASCECNESTHTYVYPSGYKEIYVNYNMSYPISHEFYQNSTLIGSCPEGPTCDQHVMLDPNYEFTSIITDMCDDDEYHDDDGYHDDYEYDDDENRYDILVY
jgi:hypothetical protein